MEPDPVILLFSLVFLFLSALVIFCQYSIVEAPDRAIRHGDMPNGKYAPLEKLLTSPRQFTTTMRYGYHFLFACFVATSAQYISSIPDIKELYTQFSQYSVLITLVLCFVVTLVFLIFARGVPRRLAINVTINTAMRVVPYARLLTLIFAPLRILVEVIVGFMVMITGGEFHERHENVTEEEIRMLIDFGEESGNIDESEKEMLHNIFDFGETNISDVMTHRTDMISFAVDSTLDEIMQTANEEGFSRYPITGDNIDDIIGILNIKDLMVFALSYKEGDKFDISAHMRKPVFVPESTKCDALFTLLNKKKTQIAIVVDEYGGTSGIITMEDLIEFVLGDIQDEYDDEEDEVHRLSENAYTLDCYMSIEDVEELLECNLSQYFDGEEYETLGGMMIAMLDRIPGRDEHPTTLLDGVNFTVIEVNDRQILKVIARKIPEPITEDKD